MVEKLREVWKLNKGLFPDFIVIVAWKNNDGEKMYTSFDDDAEVIKKLCSDKLPRQKKDIVSFSLFNRAYVLRTLEYFEHDVVTTTLITEICS